MILGILSALFLSFVLAYFLYIFFLDVNASGTPKWVNRVLMFISRWNPIQQRQTIEALSELIDIQNKRELRYLDEKKYTIEAYNTLRKSYDAALTRQSELSLQVISYKADAEKLSNQMYRMSEFLKDRSAFINAQAAELRFKEQVIQGLKQELGASVKKPAKKKRSK